MYFPRCHKPRLHATTQSPLALNRYNLPAIHWVNKRASREESFGRVMCLWVWVNNGGCTSYEGRHHVEGLSWTPITLSLERERSQRDYLLPSVVESSCTYHSRNSPAQLRPMEGLKMWISVPKPNSTGTERERMKTKIRKWRPEAGNDNNNAVQETFQIMHMVLSEFQQRRHFPLGE